MLHGIYKVAGPDLTDQRGCNVYLIQSDELIMIDSGFGANPEGVLDNITGAGLDPAHISTIILTHCHIDHIRGADWFRKRFGARIIMHELDAQVVERGDNRLTAAFCFEVFFEPMGVDTHLTGEEGVLTLGGHDIHWLHTPGHSSGSISVYVDSGQKRVLFGQDIGAPHLSEFDCDPPSWFLSMEKLLALEADVLCDGHSGVYQPREAVTRYIEHFVKMRRLEYGPATGS